MTTPTAVVAARIFDGANWFEDGALLLEGERIVRICPKSDVPKDAYRIDHDDQWLVPGFIDLQVNGGGGIRFGEETSAEAVRAITAAHARFGTTKLLPTLITDTPEVTRRALEGGREAQAARIPGFLGLHLEGPHLSLERKGAHNPSFIRPMGPTDLQAICNYRQTTGFILTTVAPENVTTEQVSTLARAGVVVSIGHSNATAERVRTYFDAGASMVTHLFNAMSQLGHREPGIVGAALDDGRVHAGLIADGIHIDPATIRIALRAKLAPGAVFLVTDAMQSIGTALSEFELNGRSIRRNEGSLKLDDGTLAGADIDMLASVKFVHEVIGLPLEHALAMASVAPAKAIGVDQQLGFLKPGYIADFVVLTDRMEHVETWIDGKKSAASR
ncbi:MAG TPA: N-acetylglucosamine-6-phosphate deacetylase [Pararhizobium sp.]|uniref:N-acetylglucosamine-6-phosphate deacetylase n=1 Tax=Pararhizobium sp. TaxID=1977563 RepID=UPI002CC41CD9|nr:N-acetylglucosamine-6-phosphate deacetylase [Pararhizobium sp.]HTO34571.1 N-acetylglucosamine-6-phosphate deacetylase [Pararhizobium sp.]